jgi:hypothetical protein
MELSILEKSKKRWNHYPMSQVLVSPKTTRYAGHGAPVSKTGANGI